MDVTKLTFKNIFKIINLTKFAFKNIVKNNNK